MAKPVWAKEDADKDSHASCPKLGLVLNPAEATLSLDTKPHVVSLLLLSATSCDKQTKPPLSLK